MSTDYLQIATNAAEQKARFDRFLSDDPLDRELQAVADCEHEAAKSRGERIHTIARHVAWELHAKGRLGTLPHPELERELVNVLAEVMYPGVAVDV